MMPRKLVATVFRQIPQNVTSLSSCVASSMQVRQMQRRPCTVYPLMPSHMSPMLTPLSINLISHRSIRSTTNLLQQDGEKKEEKVGITKKFKQMFKDYWYVLVPVHVATSAVWFGGFYFLCKSGIDVGAVLQFFGASEKYIEKLSNSSMGYAALAYACYKIATPVRYTVTIAGTTMTVKYLSGLGYLKTTHQVAEEIREKRDHLAEEMRERKEHFVGDLKDKRDHLAQEMRERKEHMRDEWSEAWHKFAQRNKKKP